MTKYILLLLASFLSFHVLSQKIEENKVDEFTGNSVKRTSWETLNMSMSFTAYFRVSKINDNYYLGIKMMMGGDVFAINEGDEIMFKLSNDEIVKLQNLEYTITCTGCGAKGFAGSAGEGIEVSYPMTKEQVQKLTSNNVVKMRVYTNKGYVENETKEKHAKKLISALKLIK